MKKAARKALLTAKLYRPGKAGGGAQMLMPGHPEREKNFHNWFNGSKIVDENGKPLVLYHGTSGDFSVFKPSRTGEFGPGIYLTTSPNEAGDYTGTHPGARNIMPVHVSMKNPLHLKSPDELWSKYPDLKSDDELPARLKADGYDGVAFHRPVQKWIDGKGLVNTGEMQTHFLVLDPNQIKSATGNQGTYDPNEDDINKAAGGRTGYADGDHSLDITDKMRDAVKQGLPAFKDGGEVDKITAYHASPQQISEFKASPARGSTFFASSPEAALSGASAGMNEWTMDTATEPYSGGMHVHETEIDPETISGLHYTPEEKNWFKSLPQRILNDEELGRVMSSRPNSRIIWDDVYDAVRNPDGTYNYVKAKSPPSITYDEARKKNRDVYGHQFSHYGHGSDEKGAALATLAKGMKGYLVRDEGGLSIAMADPSSAKIKRITEIAAKRTLQKAAGGRTGYRDGGTGYADPETKTIQDWKWSPLADVQRQLGNMTEIPSHVVDFGRFMDQTAQRAASQGLTPRDLIKAYTITRASIQRQAINSDKLREAGFVLPPSITGKIRPEGAFGEWLHSPAGQAYLDAAQKGQQHEAAIQNAAQVMKPFGKDNDLVDALRWAAQNLPGKEGQVSQLVAAGREKASSPDEWRAFTKHIRGIGPSKSGFVASLMGRGDQPTLDARQIILHTGNPAKEASKFVSRKGGMGGAEAVDRLAARQNAMNLALPDELSPYYQHLAHHAIWDKAGNERTTHQDVMNAMQHAATGGAINSDHISNHPIAIVMDALGFPGLRGYTASGNGRALQGKFGSDAVQKAVQIARQLKRGRP